MVKAFGIAHQLRTRGVIAPAFFALAIAAEAVDLQKDSPVLFWMGLAYLVVGLAFSRYTGQMLASAVSD
jgi:hypothetical protein